MERDWPLLVRGKVEDVIVLPSGNPLHGDAVVVEETVGGQSVLEHIDLAKPSSLTREVLIEQVLNMATTN